MSKAQEAETDALEYIAEQLRPLAVPVDDLNIDEENARIHPKRNLETVKLSLEKYGQRIPIIVQREGMIVRAGNARLEAARQLGWSHIAALVMDDDEAMAKAFAIMDNKSADLAEWDFQQLSDLMQELSSLDFDLEMTGFADFETEPLLQANWAPPEGEVFREGSTEQKQHHLALTDGQYVTLCDASAAYNETLEKESSLPEAITAICQQYIDKIKGRK